MIRHGKGLAWSLVAWFAVGIFWFFATRRAHPTLGLAVITTASLVTACALASYANLLVLVPKYRDSRRYLAYVGLLLATMASLTGVALAVIRSSYDRTLGPDPDPNGLYIHYAIDFSGMVVHVAGAALVARLAHGGWGMAAPRRVTRGPGSRSPAEENS